MSRPFKKGHKPWNKGKAGLQAGKNHPMYGKRHSDEARRKMSEAKKGHQINLGRHHSEEAKRKMSEKAKGRKWSIESRKKLSESLKGDKGSNWQGGKSKENHLIRDSIELRLWKEAVLARDNWTCQKTGERGVKLEVHHILNFSSHTELRTSIENGITLSKEAHKEFHRIYGKKNNTKEQLEEFLKA